MKNIRNIYRSIATMEAKMQTEYGVNLNEAALLCMLCDGEGKAMTAGEIADGLALTNSNSSKIIASVEKKALVNRKMDKADKRQMHFTLSKKGRELTERMHCSEIAIPKELEGIV